MPLFAQPSRRTALAGLLAAALATSMFSAPSPAAADERVLTVVAPWEFTSFDPSDTGYILTRMQVAETLIGVEPDGRLVGNLTQAWTTDADGLTWRFPIVAGRRHHDGTALTAETVAASLAKSFAGESLSSVPVASVTAEGDAVVIRTRTPFRPLPAFLVDYAAIILAPSSYAPDGKVTRIVATGPFRLDKVDGKTTLELERASTEGLAPGAARRVRYLAVANGETRGNMAIAGDADLVFTIAPQAAQRIAANGPGRMESLTIPRIRFLHMNLGLPQFADVRVRRALSMAIDRGAIAIAILRHPGSASTQLLPPILADWHDPKLAPLANDAAAAKKLLDEAGWVAGADGVRVKDGVRLEAVLKAPGNRPELPPMASALQAQFKAVGFAVTIDTGPSSTIPAAIKDGTLQMALTARTYVNVPDPIATVIPDYTRERSNWGTLNWDGRTAMKALTDEYVTSFDEGRRADLRRAMVAKIHDETPVIPVSWFEHTVAVSPRLGAVVVDPYEMRYFIDRVTFK